MNLATRLLVHGFTGEYEQAVVVSNDADFAGAMLDVRDAGQPRRQELEPQDPVQRGYLCEEPPEPPPAEPVPRHADRLRRYD